MSCTCISPLLTPCSLPPLYPQRARAPTKWAPQGPSSLDPLSATRVPPLALFLPILILSAFLVTLLG